MRLSTIPFRGVLMLIAVAALALALSTGCDDDRHHMSYSNQRYYHPRANNPPAVIVYPRGDRSRDRNDANWGRRDNQWSRRGDWDNRDRDRHPRSVRRSDDRRWRD